MERPTKPRSEWAMVGTSVVESDRGDFRGGGRNGPEGALPLNSAQLGLWIFLATATMLFAGFTSAYLVRRAGSDWQPIPLPLILWFNTAVLVLSSITLEIARARQKETQDPRPKAQDQRTSPQPTTIRHPPSAIRHLIGWLSATTGLGVIFLVGQLFAWRHLAAQGVYLPSNPHSSFFYILTGVHGAHLLGGIGALIYVLIKAWRAGSVSVLENRLKLCATYWHFVGGLWLYLFLVLFVF